ncbi:MAG TPA: hypothetical protein ENH19_03955 [Actinobacteria bacterium]|nr:hypothetical protein [Actinomycetes bacterium]HEX21787.1 hypothetical protein [Actinomycetota bacterium]
MFTLGIPELIILSMILVLPGVAILGLIIFIINKSANQRAVVMPPPPAMPNDTRRCHNCGANLKTSLNFCTQCGENLIVNR